MKWGDLKWLREQRKDISGKIGEVKKKEKKKRREACSSVDGNVAMRSSQSRQMHVFKKMLTSRGGKSVVHRSPSMLSLKLFYNPKITI